MSSEAAITVQSWPTSQASVEQIKGTSQITAPGSIKEQRRTDKKPMKTDKGLSCYVMTAQIGPHLWLMKIRLSIPTHCENEILGGHLCCTPHCKPFPSSSLSPISNPTKVLSPCVWAWESDGPELQGEKSLVCIKAHSCAVVRVIPHPHHMEHRREQVCSQTTSQVSLFFLLIDLLGMNNWDADLQTQSILSSFSVWVH